MINEINELLLEALLNENIPRDLLAAYKRSTKFSSDKYSGEHSELVKSGSGDRRFATYDYGKASYEKISPEEAIAYVKADKNNIENLRIIFDDDLVEFEVRPNGSIYAIYRNSNKPATIDGVTKNNIGYFSWKPVLLNADAIYKTDEYQKKIPSSEIDARKDKSKMKIQGSVPNLKSSHNPYYDFTDPNKGFKLTRAVMDTGDHNPSEHDYKTSRRLLGYNLLDGPDTAGLDAISRQDDHQNVANFSFDYYSEYLQKLREKDTAYIKFNQLRRALKKLENEKSDYDEDEYLELKNKWEERKKVAEKEYNKIAKEVSNLKSKLFVEISDAADSISKKFYKFVMSLQILMDRGYKASKQIDEITQKEASGEAKLSYSNSLRVKDIKKAVIKILNSIEEKKRSLNELQANLTNDNDELITSINNDVENSEAMLSDYMNELDEIDSTGTKANVDYIRNLTKELGEIELEIGKLRPSYQARRQANRDKNKTEEDPRLLNLLDFS